MSDDLDDFEEGDGWDGWEHGKDEFRLSDETWTRLETIVRRAKGDVASFRAKRGIVELIIGTQKEMKDLLDDVDTRYIKHAKEWARAEAATNDLIPALKAVQATGSRLKLLVEGEIDLTEPDPAFDDIINILSNFSKRAAQQRLGTPIKKGRKPSIARTISLKMLLKIWVDLLGLKIATGTTSHVGQFLQELLKSIPWISEADRSDGNIRAYLRDYVKRERDFQR